MAIDLSPTSSRPAPLRRRDLPTTLPSQRFRVDPVHPFDTLNYSLEAGTPAHSRSKIAGVDEWSCLPSPPLALMLTTRDARVAGINGQLNKSSSQLIFPPTLHQYLPLLSFPVLCVNSEIGALTSFLGLVTTRYFAA